MGLILPKKYPRKKVLPVALAQVELDALQLEAKQRGMGASTLAHQMLVDASLHGLVEKHLGIERSALDEGTDHD